MAGRGPSGDPFGEEPCSVRGLRGAGSPSTPPPHTHTPERGRMRTPPGVKSLRLSLGCRVTERGGRGAQLREA